MSKAIAMFKEWVVQLPIYIMQRKFQKNFQIILLASAVVYGLGITHDVYLTVEIKREHEGYEKS